MRILLSSQGLPSKKIGSWTNRLSFFLKEHPEFFDWILSPSEYPAGKFLFCSKKKPYPRILLKLLGSTPARSSARHFLNGLETVCKDSTYDLHLIVIDDLALLEAACHWKGLRGNRRKIRIDFSFHGHSFYLPTSFGSQVDNVFFLTHSGYKDTLIKNDIFTPRVQVVGNGTDSQIFFPLNVQEKSLLKMKLGYQTDTPVLLWVSNPRPQKGLKLFLELIKRLQAKYPAIHVLIIGNKEELELQSPNVKALGRIPNIELAKYLQIGDFYFFTSLWKEGFGLSLIEAAKCGNQVIASNLGGISEVLESLPGSFLVDEPNLLESWENAFDLAWEQKDNFYPDADLLIRYHDLKDWKIRFFQALST